MIGLGTLPTSLPSTLASPALEAGGLSPATARRLRTQVLAASAGLAALVLGLGLWATRVEFSGAVVTSGLLVVESQVKKVQHPTGGVIGELRVRDGSPVHAGDVLVRLDATLLQANFAIVSKALDESLARRPGSRPSRRARTRSPFRPNSSPGRRRPAGSCGWKRS